MKLKIKANQAQNQLIFGRNFLSKLQLVASDHADNLKLVWILDFKLNLNLKFQVNQHQNNLNQGVLHF